MQDEVIMCLVLVGTIALAAWLTAQALIRWSPTIKDAVSTETPSRHLYLDGLRGVLALAVIGHHVIIMQTFVNEGEWHDPMSPAARELGAAAVVMFFMITSFLFWGRVIDTAGQIQWPKFFIARFFRLAPLYFVLVATVCLIAVWQSGWTLGETLPEFAKHVLEWLAFALRGMPDIGSLHETVLVNAGTAWTLRYEWAFYCTLPALAFVFSRRRDVVMGIASVLTLVLFWRCTRGYPFDPHLAFSFFGGFVAAYWIRNKQSLAAARHPLFGVLALLVLVAIFVFDYVPFSALPQFALTLAFVAITAKNRFFAWLTAAPCRWCGEISYGVYLFHGIFLWLATQVVWRGSIFHPGASSAVYVALALGTTIGVILLATAMHLLIEAPGIRTGRRVASLRFFSGQDESGVSRPPIALVKEVGRA